ncbi:hypothetical protein SAMN04488136_103262 [Vibrio xiamenensis]|uniref:Uncharacterized protein n=1 Tax=Vibrio xiamenensis TaxID=861298 RepID=A0A1G7XMA5_9VIBR|nr:hypothetical protein SAMN04488136_103262 [Vibrio xiamenensis]
MSFEVVLVGSSSLMRLTRVYFFSICDSAPVPDWSTFELSFIGRQLW